MENVSFGRIYIQWFWCLIAIIIPPVFLMHLTIIWVKQSRPIIGRNAADRSVPFTRLNRVYQELHFLKWQCENWQELRNKSRKCYWFYCRRVKGEKSCGAWGETAVFRSRVSACLIINTLPHKANTCALTFFSLRSNK